MRASFQSWPWVRALAASAVTTLIGGAISRQLLHSLNDPVPALLGAITTHAEPAEASPPAKPTTRVVMIVLDGVGERALLPLAERGALGPIAAIIPVDTGVPSLSRPGYHVSLTGVPQRVSGIRANFSTTARADSVADRVHAAGGTVAFLQESVPWYGELFAKPADFVSSAPWAGGTAAFARASEHGAALVVVHLTGADNAGHGSGAGSEAYRWTIDRQIEAIVALVKQAEGTPRERDTRWLVGADHGHTQAGGHGGPEPDVTQVSWLLLAAGRDRDVPTHRVRTRRSATVIAPLIAQLLGVEAPRHALAEPPPLPPTIAAPRPVPRMLLPRLFAVQEAEEAHALAIRRRMALTQTFFVLAFAVALWRLSWSQLLAAAAPTVLATVAFALLGPGFTLSAIHSEQAFLRSSLFVIALGGGFGWSLSRRTGTAIETALFVGLLPALTTFALTAGSLGTSDLGPVATLLSSSTGLLPPGLALGVVGVELGARFVARARRRRGDPPPPMVEGPHELR